MLMKKPLSSDGPGCKCLSCKSVPKTVALQFCDLTTETIARCNRRQTEYMVSMADDLEAVLTGARASWAGLARIGGTNCNSHACTHASCGFNACTHMSVHTHTYV